MANCFIEVDRSSVSVMKNTLPEGVTACLIASRQHLNLSNPFLDWRKLIHGANKQQSQGKDRQFLSIKISVKKCLDCVFIKRYNFGFSLVINCKPVVERYHM